MCGICGAYDTRATPDVEPVRRMLGALAHRGPDGSGLYRDHTVVLGHTRLAIVDPANGVQPLCNEDGQVWVTFNGEIFNFVELAAQLSDRGHRFRTRCDTEVIVHAWEEWGSGCFERFNGQWALAIWDRRTRRLVLSRDRFGVRPLYYARIGGRVVFASEVKALFTDPMLRRELDPRGLDQVLTFWSAVAPTTPFRGVSQVPPGCHLVISDGEERLQRHWQPTFPERGAEPNQRLDDNARALRERLVEATRLRFQRSDVPVGGYLSGGIDSAITAATIATFTDVPLHTFSLRFRNREFDEGPYQRLLVDRLGSVHSDVVVDEQEIAAIFPDVVSHAESPLLRTAPAPMFLLSRLVREAGYKVVVTGEGADEVLGGYDIFREARTRLFRARDPGSVTRPRSVELLYPWMRRSPNRVPAFAQSFFGRNLDPDDFAVSHRPRWDATATLKRMLVPEWQAAAGSQPEDELLGLRPPGSGKWDALSRAQWLEMVTLLPGYILSSQGDRMLMANSVEGRFPFLDPTVAELAAGFPSRQKMLGLEEKYLLKRAFADLLPDEVVHRPKQPYRAPDASSFFSGDPPEWLDDVVSGDAIHQAGIFQAPMVARLLEKCRGGRGRELGNTDNMRLVLVLSVQLLHRGLLRGGVAPGEPPTPTIVREPPPATEPGR